MLVERGAVCRVVVSAAQSPGRRGTFVDDSLLEETGFEP
jgi:hypothetical protein